MAFVKFSRGLSSQFNNLAKKDQDTLYLIYDSTSSETGQLYLGNKLISSAGVSSVNLNTLTDVTIPTELEDGMLLQYIKSSNKWEAVPLNSVINNSGSNNGISVVDDLNTIENPSENDIAIEGTELFIYNGTKWQPLTVSDLEDRVSKLENEVGHEANSENGQVATGLYKKIEDLRSDLQAQISSEIINAQHLRYTVVNNISEIDLTDEEATQNTVFLVPKSTEDTRADDGYDEYLVNNGVLEKIGSWDADLTNYVQNTDDRLLDNEQKQKLDSIGLDSNNQAIISTSQVDNLQDFIDNNQYINSVQAGVFSVNDHNLELISIPSNLLSNYISTPTFNSTVGDLRQLTNRVSTNSTLVDEINTIKASVIWQELTQS